MKCPKWFVVYHKLKAVFVPQEHAIEGKELFTQALNKSFKSRCKPFSRDEYYLEKHRQFKDYTLIITHKTLDIFI